MTKTDHLAKAKDYIAKGDDYHRRAADEMIAARHDDPMLTYKEIGERVGRSESWCHRLVQKRTELSDPKEPFFGGDDQNAARYERHVKQVLRDPERRKQAIASLSHDERVEVVKEISTSVPEPEPREAEVDLRGEMQDAVATDLSAQVAKLIAGASRIDLLLAERGAEFRRIDSEAAARMDADLERVVNTIRDVRAELLKHREIGVAS